MVVLIHRPPQIIALALDRQQDLVEMPLIPRLSPSVSKLIGIGLAKLAAPLPDRFVGHDDPTGKQELFRVAVAETEAGVQTDAMADDFDTKTMMLVMDSKGWCVHEPNIAHQTTVVQARR